MRLILARHGETHFNRDGIILGIGDEPLDTVGIGQARRLADALAKDLPFKLYASPVARAWKTGRIISEHLHVPVVPLAGLAEADSGDLSGLTGREMRRRFPEFAAQWARNPSTAVMPGGESMVQVQRRAWRAVSELLAAHPDETVVAVSHNFTMSAIVSKVLGMPLRHFLRLKIDLGGISRFELSPDRGVVISMNETAHVPCAPPADG